MDEINNAAPACGDNMLLMPSIAGRPICYHRGIISYMPVGPRSLRRQLCIALIRVSKLKGQRRIQRPKSAFGGKKFGARKSITILRTSKHIE